MNDRIMKADRRFTIERELAGQQLRSPERNYEDESDYIHKKIYHKKPSGSSTIENYKNITPRKGY